MPSGYARPPRASGPSRTPRARIRKQGQHGVPMIRPFLHVRHSIVSCVRCRPAQRLCDAFVSPNARTELCDAGVAKELCEFAREAFVQSIDAEPWILSKCAVWVFGCPRLGVFRRHTECPRIGEGLAVAGGSPGSSANVGVSAGGLAVECDQQAGQQARQARPRSRIHAPAREQVRVLVVLGAAASPCVPRWVNVGFLRQGCDLKLRK